MRRRQASPPIVVPCYLLEVFLTGRLELAIGQEHWQCFSAGTGVLYRPGVPFRERITPDVDACHSISLFFELPDSPLYEAWFDGRLYRGIEDPSRLIIPRSELVLRHLGQSESDDLIAHGALCQSLGCLLGSPLQDGRVVATDTAAAPPSDLVEKVQRLMRRRLDHPLTVTDLARHVDMSESGLAHAYRRLTGRTPMADLRRIRIDAVKLYLLHNRLPLSAIAEQTGFADAFHLSRSFKQVEGISPRTYRQRLLAPPM